MNSRAEDNKAWWDEQSSDYQATITISTRDFHYGPLLPGDSQLELLPADLTKKRCLELACGAGQNSLYLASQGADCVAIDLSPMQIEAGRAQAHSLNLDVTFMEGDMDQIPDLGKFDLVHSNSLTFSDNPQAFLKQAFDCLTPGGHLVLAGIHPLFAAEWVELGDEGCGLFVTDYFSPPDDIRESASGESTICSRSWPVSTILNWVIDAGFRVSRMEEPQAVDKAMIQASPDATPYFSPEWMVLHEQLSKTPVMLIIAADKPA